MSPEQVTDKRVEELFNLADEILRAPSRFTKDFVVNELGQAVAELVGAVERARADAARCQATNESDLYGTIRCDKPGGHDDDHEAQTDEAYSRWVRKDVASARRLSEVVERAKRAEKDLAELRAVHEGCKFKYVGAAPAPGVMEVSPQYEEGEWD